MLAYLLLLSAVGSASTEKVSHSAPRKLAPFMMTIAAILFVLCIVYPLAIPGWSKLPVALPLMAVGMLLPFAFFFIFAGSKLARNRKSAK